MKPTPNSPSEPPPPLLAFGAHPDDVEFGAGAIVAAEAQSGRPVHLVVCSRGEAGTNGTPDERAAEAAEAAGFLGAKLEFLPLDGDSHLELRTAHAITLAAVIRRLRPAIVLAPTPAPNQHPDHWRLGQLVRDAARIARYGGVAELREQPAHAIDQLFFYALGSGSEPDTPPILIDVSSPAVIAAWTSAMSAHASQLKTRNYVESQLSRAHVHGLAAGVPYAQPLWPNDPLMFSSLAPLTRSARRF
jgi:LmbE family N-acetylglucosaminyl deacetylase